MDVRVPIVGLQKRQVTMGELLISATILCDCGSPLPITIPNVDRAGLCKACKTKYVIAKVEFKNDANLVHVNWDVAKWMGPMSATQALDVTFLNGPSKF
jgi:hypothetical protein